MHEEPHFWRAVHRVAVVDVVLLGNLRFGGRTTDGLVLIPWDWLASEKAEICADAFAFAKWDIPR